MRTFRKSVVCLVLAILAASLRAQAQGSDVIGRIHILERGSAPAKMPAPKSSGETVVWLTAIDAPGARPIQKGTYRLLQKNKQFSPHLLVIPTGSTVEFPNMDPFFHNVFSLYDGKRFDLGLYESGAKRGVVFDREGISYIFCNIHPEMGAIVLAVSTPYYAIAKENGSVTIHNVPPGTYRLHLWSEAFQPVDHSGDRRVVQVTAEGGAFGPIDLAPGLNPLVNHKNKFGEDYPAGHPTPY
ncbi:MAG TPA: hypothetical protein VL346_07675 [Acidobacteriaceae bacterium]|nr:hypothetical protein [Acidobacteriaceae bacterium]